MNQDNNAIFNDNTKKICACSFTALILTLLFVISPLSSFLMTSVFFKLVILVILAYTISMHIKQTNELTNAKQLAISSNIEKQVQMNLLCSYTLTFFLILLFLFVTKSLFAI